MDFTITSYKKLLQALLAGNYTFLTFDAYIKSDETTINQFEKLVVLRHDVDDRPQNSLAFAEIQSELGIKGTYYFRKVPQSFDVSIIEKIKDLGHEIGYHYETMDTCKGNIDDAYKEFVVNLDIFNKLIPISTISMHGSPMSKFDNRKIWEKYDYKTLGIIAEPYFDINFDKLYYITDTGRCWNGHLFNVRDKATKDNPLTNKDFISKNYHSTPDIIYAIQNNTFPFKTMMNFHPQRWNSNLYFWTKELVLQNIKNQVKKIIVKKMT